MIRLLLPMTCSIWLVIAVFMLGMVFLGNKPVDYDFPLLSLVIGLAIALLLVVSFWSWLLWREFIKLQQSADAFGVGNYAVRLPDCPYSPLATITQAFNRMAERTQHSINTQRELTAAVSHELRTPIARMRFALDMLASSDNEADHQRHIASMNVDMDELNHMLTELLVYARLEQNGASVTHIKLVDVQQWLDQCMGRLIVLSADKTLTWTLGGVSGEEYALFDPVMMCRALENLVQNAFRHAHSCVTVRFDYTSTHYCLQVDDDGIGIPVAERERLFEPFAVLDTSRNKDNAGFGLGLAIVKKIAVAHSGVVVIQDALLGGARFVISWPFHAVE